MPHVWPSPVHASPADLAARLAAHGFHDVGGGHVMVLEDPAGEPAGRAPASWRRGVTVHAIRDGRRTPGPRTPTTWRWCSTESFGALPGRAASLAGELRRTLDDPRIVLVLVRVGGEPAAAAKATTFDGLTYISSVGTRVRVPRPGARRDSRRATRSTWPAAPSRAATYLGVFSGNEPAMRLYERLGFASVGESPDLLLE